RFAGLQALLSSPYTLDGAWSDDPEKRGAWAVQNVRQTHGDFGTFRTPSLRGVAETAPYMHDGSLEDLNAVVRHYSEIDLERLHADGEAILVPLELTEAETQDLVAFLETLSAAPESKSP
ncbi:MAG: cytochrome-c peroxidase, partial [Pseudomonadota bacterium]